jgi:hypothetical protein
MTAEQGNMKRRPLIAGMMVALCLSLATDAQAPAWLGMWRFEPTQSSFTPGPPPFVRATRRVESSPHGIRLIEELVRPRGGVTHLEWTGALDGSESRVHGVDLFVTYAYRQVDDRTLEAVVKVDGRVTSRSRETVSEDGQTLTIQTAGENAQQGLRSTMVFLRRE